MAKIFFSILNTAKFPKIFSKGSDVERFAKSRELSKQLLAELEKSTKYTDEFIFNSISKVLAPYNINVTIEPNRLKTRGGHRHNIKVEETRKGIKIAIIGHIICLAPNTENRDKYTILHEAGHLFDSALNPKSMRCDYIKLVNKNEIYNVLQEIKDRFLGISDVKKLKKETPQILKRIPDEYVIDTMQSIRYHLKTEINQYRQCLKFMFLDRNVPTSDLINECYLYFRLKFNQKLSFANKLLKERISDARKKHKY